MMRLLVAAFAGALFGVGLMVAGMTDTAKVQGWLDVFGAWDPTLAFVLGAALLPMALAWAWIGRRGTSLAGIPAPARPAGGIDRPLILGAAVFGAGWALVGLCPGPSLAALLWGGAPVAVFVAAMVAGMLLARPIQRRVPALQAG